MGQEVRYLFYSLLLMRASGWPQQETYTCSEEGLLDGRTWDLRTDCDGRYRDKKGAPLLERYEMVMDGIHLERALAPANNVTRNARLQDVAHNLRTGRMVTIAVIGGSVVYGIGCKDGLDRTRMRCAWPGRLGRALCAMFPAAGVRIVDLSVPATNLHSFLTRSPEIFKREKAPADLYIIDYNLNDRRVIKDTLVDVVTLIDILRRRAGGNAAILFLETLGHYGKHVPKAWRKQIPGTWHLSDVHSAIFASLGVPWVSYRDAIWPVLRQGPERACFYEGPIGNKTEIEPNVLYGGYVCWDGKVHPTWRVHQLLADIVSTLFLRLARGESCRVSTAAPPIIPAQGQLPHPRQVCITPHTVLSSKNAASFVASRAGIGWSFYEDVKGKPGWIGNVPGTTVSFDVNVSHAPMLSMTYLRSYDAETRMASAVVTLVCASRASTVAILNGSWNDPTSLEVAYEWKESKPMPVGASVNKPSACRVDVTVLAPLHTRMPIKFKLTSLLSC